MSAKITYERGSTTFLSKVAGRYVLMSTIYGLGQVTLPQKNWHRPGSSRKVINELD